MNLESSIITLPSRFGKIIVNGKGEMGESVDGILGCEGIAELGRYGADSTLYRQLTPSWAALPTGRAIYDPM